MPLLNTAQVAALLKRPERTVRWQAAHGAITGIRVGRDWVFSEAYIKGLVGGIRPDTTHEDAADSGSNGEG